MKQKYAEGIDSVFLTCHFHAQLRSPRAVAEAWKSRRVFRMSNRHEKEKGVNVQVLLRCRPFSEEELRNNAPQVVTCNEHQREVSVSQNIAGKHFDRVFTFDKVFGPNAQQKDLYEQAIVPIVNEVLEGFNCTIFAYGQTGTGKTYTMEGECKRAKSGANGELPQEAGVIPRSVQQIFDTLESQNAEYSVKVTFLELYNEEITDLLAPEDISKVTLDDKQRKLLPLMEDGKGGVLVRGLEEEIVASANEIYTLLERGSAKRRTAETLLNKQSSRSHSLFSITIHIKEATPEGEELIKCGKLNLVDLAGSENISRSGAREGRAREAGEINKSLLTLGRVINALVEHLAHIPYRDSKLTRLLRDSLGGRTKTCIIATVSPAVHCLEETLSTLDYAHRAKNIRNRPEVNQKMMKSTLIKDLYGEIERLKSEVYAAREKNGVYIPKERFYQEEAEKKAMADQIEQMGITIESNQKQIVELQVKYEGQVQQSADLSNELKSTRRNLDLTSKLLAGTEEELKRCQYAIKEQDFVISEQRKAENALADQACALRSDLERSQRDTASLFLKISREEKLNSDNRKIVNTYQAELSDQLGSLCDSLTVSVSQQREHLQCVENMCNSFLQIHDKAFSEIRKKISSCRALFVSHIEAVQNIVCLHKADSNAALEELSSLSSSSSIFIHEFLEAETVKAKAVFDELHENLSNHHGEMKDLAGELRQRFDSGLEHLENTSTLICALFGKLNEESKSLEGQANDINEVQSKSIAEFQKTYEEHSRSEAQKLITEMTSLVFECMRRQKEMVDERLGDIKDIATGNKKNLDGHASRIGGIATDLKRKWEDYYLRTGASLHDNAELCAAKHCRLESLVDKCVSNSEVAFEGWRRMQDTLIDMGNRHTSSFGSNVRIICENNEKHYSEIEAARLVAEDDIKSKSEVIVCSFDRLSGEGNKCISDILTSSKSHGETLVSLERNHSQQSACIQQHAVDALCNKYTEYDPTGTTPVRCDPEIPTKGTIESLRAMPTEALKEEFRENNAFENFQPKESKSQQQQQQQQQYVSPPRAPFSQIN
ncbi:hypothetical protein M569_01542 [Genlisea aurea]|uniref:Kinesin motor domain-containing protein n=1 Tax=Genlisea aurea TaxID=192259 RepID=S8EBA5_9LAMI|nr:hypothetical protein M569_01542 [Genlisea aurea]